MRARMLNVAARRSVLAGGRGTRRHCTCIECATTKSKGSQRQHERRAWRRDADL